MQIDNNSDTVIQYLVINAKLNRKTDNQYCLSESDRQLTRIVS